MGKHTKIYNEDGRKIVEGLSHYKGHRPLSSFKELVDRAADEYGNKIAFKIKSNNSYIDKSYIDFKNDIDSIGTAITNRGIPEDTRIAVIGENSYEWCAAFLSITNGLGIAVPLDKNLKTVEIENSIIRGKVSIIFFTDKHLDSILELSKKDIGIKLFISMDNKNISSYGDMFVSFDTLLSEGQNLIKSGVKSYIDKVIDSEKLSILLFTSGTTSLSKCVMLSQRNVCSNIDGIFKMIELTDKEVHLALLPLHHTFENTVGLLYATSAGIQITFCDGIKHIQKNLQEYKCSIVITVPALLEIMYGKIKKGIKKQNKEKLVNALFKISSFLLKMKIDLRKVLFKSIRDQLCPELRFFIVGAAPISSEIVKFFEDIGICVIQGYGLTETSPILSLGTEFLKSTDSVGIPLPGVKISIDNPDDTGNGEIIAKGDNVMLGYYENEEENKEAFTDDGWFRTGDIGNIDKNGILRITGRCKSMIVLTNGKKAFPEEYEFLLMKNPEIADCMVWGNKALDGDIQICAEIIPDRSVLENMSDEEISVRLNEIVQKINQDIPSYKMLRYFFFTDNEFIKTSTLKVKRVPEQQKIEERLKQLNLDIRKVHKKNIDLL